MPEITLVSGATIYKIFLCEETMPRQYITERVLAEAARWWQLDMM